MQKKFFYQKNKYSRGVALVFAIILSVILFTFAAGVLNIATKELNFSTSAKNSNNAFYAADSGVECALFNDMGSKPFFTKESEPTIFCFGKEINLGGGFPDFNFTILELGPDAQSCAKVLIRKPPDESVLLTQIVSKGYNMGGGDDCNQLNLNSTERVIEVLY